MTKYNEHRNHFDLIWCVNVLKIYITNFTFYTMDLVAPINSQNFSLLLPCNFFNHALITLFWVLIVLFSGSIKLNSAIFHYFNSTRATPHFGIPTTTMLSRTTTYSVRQMSSTSALLNKSTKPKSKAPKKKLQRGDIWSTFRCPKAYLDRVIRVDQAGGWVPIIFTWDNMPCWLLNTLI